jgi:hypothetical protein
VTLLLCKVRLHKHEKVDLSLDYCTRCETLLPNIVYTEASLGYLCGVFEHEPWKPEHAAAYERQFGDSFPGEVA